MENSEAEEREWSSYDDLDVELSKVETLIAQDARQKAARRLGRILLEYSHDLASLGQVGELYSQAGYHSMAGLCWYLLPAKGGRMDEACRRFEQACGDSPLLVYRILEAMDLEVDSSNPIWRKLRQDAGEEEEEDNAEQLLDDRPQIRPGCGRAILLALLVFLVVGAWTTIRWIISLLW